MSDYHQALSRASNPDRQMNPEREAHLVEISKRFSDRLGAKYRQGQAEHGGNVWDRDPLSDAEGEILDLWVYHCSQRRRTSEINDLAGRLQVALSKGDYVSMEALTDRIFDLTVTR